MNFLGLNRTRGTLCEPLYRAGARLNRGIVLSDEPYGSGAELRVRVNVRDTTFAQMKGHTLETVRITDNLCEFCGQPVSSDQVAGKAVTISTTDDHQSMLSRAAAHDRVEVDFEENTIYVYDHAYPCVFHQECLRKA